MTIPKSELDHKIIQRKLDVAKVKAMEIKMANYVKERANFRSQIDDLAKAPKILKNDKIAGLK